MAQEYVMVSSRNKENISLLWLPKKQNKNINHLNYQIQCSVPSQSKKFSQKEKGNALYCTVVERLFSVHWVTFSLLMGSIERIGKRLSFYEDVAFTKSYCWEMLRRVLVSELLRMACRK